MIPLTICVGILALVFWFTNKYERHIRVMAKRYEPKIRLDRDAQKTLIEACDLLMEVHTDPQSQEYRTAVELKLRLEKALRDD